MSRAYQRNFENDNPFEGGEGAAGLAKPAIYRCCTINTKELLLPAFQSNWVAHLNLR